MPSLPNATTTIDAEAGVLAGGSGYCVIMAPVPLDADAKPRVYSGFKGLIAKHGYAPGVDYAAVHIDRTNKPVLFCGLPIATPGVVGRENDEGVLGSSSITATEGPYGALEEVDAILTILKGGEVGTDQIFAELSLDGGHTSKKIKIGDASSYTIPYVGITLNFGVGTLLAGDEYTFSSTAPLSDQDGIAAALAELKKAQKPARTWMVIGDFSDSTAAGHVVSAANSYETSKQRFVFARIALRDRLPLAQKSKVTKKMTGAPNITFAEVGATGDTITRSSGSFIDDGFAVNDTVTVAGAVASSGANNVTGKIASLTDTVITFDTTDLVNEGPIGGVSITASETITFAEVGATGDTITRSSGSWLDDGFRDGDVITVTDSASNNVTGAIDTVTASVITMGSTDLAAESIRSDAFDIVKGETVADWISSLDAEFASIAAQKRINIGVGRGRVIASPIHGWDFRRPSQWGVSVREYQKDVHVPTWRKEDGPLLDISIVDEHGNVVEFDEANDGGALSAGFTCYRTWGNGPEGTFVAMDLTRDVENSPLQLAHNMTVANIMQTIVQSETELVVGKTLRKDAQNHAFEADLRKIEERVNTSLRIALMEEKVPGEGPRASLAKWTASRTDDLSGSDAALTGAGDLIVNGTIVHVNTVVRVR